MRRRLGVTAARPRPIASPVLREPVPPRPPSFDATCWSLRMAMSAVSVFFLPSRTTVKAAL